MSSRAYRRDSQERSHSRSRDHDRSRSPERAVSLPGGASPISESDYFLKSDEFRVWLRSEKRKVRANSKVALMTHVLIIQDDELSSDKSRKYFRKFVKAWNRGDLSKSLYVGVDAQPASSQTGYKWTFASKASKADSDALRAARAEVGAATYNRSSDPSIAGSGRFQGPTLPSQSDLTLAREMTEEQRREERDFKRKRDRKEGKERLEEIVGPKAVGKEGMLEKKRAKREADKSFREKGDDGFDVDDDTLMGGGDSFKAQLARREAARRRYEEKKSGPLASTRERTDAIRQKDKATMDMFMQMAKEKYG